MKWYYYVCCKCPKTFRTTIDNPNSHIKCVNCGSQDFIPISKQEYEEEHRSRVIS